MGLKILHSADWHLDSPFGGFSPDERAFLRDKQRAIPGKIADLCRKEGCDLVLLAGDIFDGQPAGDTVQLVKRELERCGVPVLISPGNHDFCSVDSPWTTETWPDNVYIFRGGMECVTISSLDCKIYGAGYESMDCPGLLKGFRAEGGARYQIGLLHGDPTSAASPNCPITAAQVRSSGLGYLALGHIHRSGYFRAGSTTCAWPGCPMGRGWDETGDKGVCIVTMEDTVSVRAVSLELPRFVDLEVDVTGEPLAALEQALPGSAGEDFYRVTLTGYGQPDLGQLQGHFADIRHLELRDQTQPPIDLWADAGEDTLEGVFFHKLKTAMEQDPERGEITALAAEISRRILDGREVIL